MRAMGISLFIILFTLSFHAEAKLRAARSFSTSCSRSLASVSHQFFKIAGYEISSNLLSKRAMTEKFLEDLLQNKIGLPVSDGTRNYDLLFSEDEVKVYKITVYRNVEAQKEIITNISQIHLSEQAEYYKALAEQMGFKTVEFKLNLPNYTAYAYITGKVQAKMKFKHGISIQDALRGFKDPLWHKKMVPDREGNHAESRDRFILKNIDPQGRVIKVVFALEEKKIKIITAFISYNN